MLNGPHQTDVLIGGAGIAGLAASESLKVAGIPHRILEATFRSGGRIHTYQSQPLLSDDPPIELGAEFGHGVRATSITGELLAKHGLTTLPDSNNEATFVDGKFHATNDPSLPRSEALIMGLIDEARAALRQNRSDKSVAEFLRETAPGRKASDMALLKPLIEGEWAADLEQLGLQGLLEHDFLGFNDDNWRVNGGYGQLIHKMTDSRLISYKTPIEELWNDDTGVRIRSGKSYFQARYAILTMPLSVFQRGHMTFHPELPDWKRSAIDEIGIGTACKIFVWVQKPFWEKDMAVLRTEKKTWWRPGWGTENEQPLLVAMVGGSEAVRLERAPVEEVIAEVQAELRQAFGVSTAKIRELKRTSWGTEPRIGMAYSYLPAGVPREKRLDLQRPVGNVHFAGEATSHEMPASVHGAIHTGTSAAQAIAQRMAEEVRFQRAIG